MALGPEPVVEPQARLRRLVARGFRFVHPRDAGGNLVAVVGVRAHHGVIDVVELWSEDEVTARRVPGDESDVLFPERELWSRSGPSGEVLDELLDLPDARLDDMAGAAAGQKGCWIPVRSGATAWLGATS